MQPFTNCHTATYTIPFSHLHNSIQPHAHYHSVRSSTCNFDLLVLHILILSWIEPNQGQKTSPWAWHCWTPGLVHNTGQMKLSYAQTFVMNSRIVKKTERKSKVTGKRGEHHQWLNPSKSRSTVSQLPLGPSSPSPFYPYFVKKLKWTILKVLFFLVSPPKITVLLKIKIKFSTFLFREKTKATSIFFNLLISNRERLKVSQYFVKQLLRNIIIGCSRITRCFYCWMFYKITNLKQKQRIW